MSPVGLAALRQKLPVTYSVKEAQESSLDPKVPQTNMASPARRWRWERGNVSKQHSRRTTTAPPLLRWAWW
jgi:hypothetical protein